MKKVLIVILLLQIILTYSFSQQLNFGNYHTISTGADGYGRARIVTVSNGDPLIVWRKDSSPKLLKATRWSGSNFASSYDITSAGVNPNSWDGPEVAAKGDTVYVVFTSLATTQTSIMLIKSFDGGLTFSDTIRVSKNDPLHKFRMGNIAIDKSGNPVVSYMQYLLNWMEPKQMVNKSNDFGNSFIGAVEASHLSPGEPCDCCKSSLVIDNDNIYLLYRNNDNNVRNSFVAKSSNGGLSFDTYTDLDDFNWIVSSCPATTPKGIINNDSLTVVRKSGATGNNEVVISSIHKTSLSSAQCFNIDYPPPGTIQNYPEIDNNGDSLFVVWQDNRNGLTDCFIKYSFNGVNNLAHLSSFTDSSVTGPKLNPHVAYSNDKLHLVYTDYSAYSIKYVKANLVNTTFVNENKSSQKKYFNFDLLGRKNRNSNYKIILESK